MDLELWIGIGVAALYPLMAVAETLWPARRFPRIPHWHLIGIGLFLYIGVLNTVVLELLPLEWLAVHRLLDLSGLGVVAGVVIGQLATTLVMYGWHRATHAVNFLWRGFHQLHHAPRRMGVYVSGFNHPFDLTIYIAIPFLVGLLVLGLDPLAAVILGNIAGLNAILQHSNLATPRWLSLIAQRPEAHCIHHQRGLHRYNYSDLPLWDMIFGTYRNPATWEGESGFDPPADRRYARMLAFADVNAPLLGEHSFGQQEATR